MQITNVNKKIAKLACLITMLSLTLVGTVTATFCWFKASKQIQTNTENISIVSKEEASDFDISYKVLKFDDIYKKGVENKTNSGDSTFKMDPYDNFIENRNDYLSQIVEFTITSTEDHPHGGYVFLKMNRTQAFLSSTGTNKVSAYISNVVKFDACLYSYTMNNGTAGNTFFTMGNVNRYKKSIDPQSTEGYADNNDKVYQEVRYYLDNSTSKAVYSYVDETSITNLPDPSQTQAYTEAMKSINSNKLSDINFRIDSQRGTSYFLPSSFKTATFYLRYDYSKILTTFFANNQNATVYEGSSISVLNDIAEITVRIQHNAQ